MVDGVRKSDRLATDQVVLGVMSKSKHTIASVMIRRAPKMSNAFLDALSRTAVKRVTLGRGLGVSTQGIIDFVKGAIFEHFIFLF